jgi:hypothetical protein
MKSCGLVFLGGLVGVLGLDSGKAFAQYPAASFAPSSVSPFQNQHRRGGPITSNYLALVRARTNQAQAARRGQQPGLVFPKAAPKPIGFAVVSAGGVGFMTHSGFFDRFGLFSSGGSNQPWNWRAQAFR